MEELNFDDDTNESNEEDLTFEEEFREGVTEMDDALCKIGNNF